MQFIARRGGEGENIRALRLKMAGNSTHSSHFVVGDGPAGHGRFVVGEVDSID